jgi:hypothetical protein
LNFIPNEERCENSALFLFQDLAQIGLNSQVVFETQNVKPDQDKKRAAQFANPFSSFYTVRARSP